MYNPEAAKPSIAMSHSASPTDATLAPRHVEAQPILEPPNALVEERPAQVGLANRLRIHRMPRIREVQALQSRLVVHPNMLERPLAENLPDWASIWNMESEQNATRAASPAVLFQAIERTRQQLVLEMVNNLPVGNGALSLHFQLKNDSIRLLSSLSNTVALISSITELALRNTAALTADDHQNNLFQLHLSFVYSCQMYTAIMRVVNQHRYPNTVNANDALAGNVEVPANPNNLILNPANPVLE